MAAKRSTPLIDPSTTVVATAAQVSCELGEETAILHTESGVYYGLDPVGTRVWQLLQEPVTVAEIRDAMLREFDVSAAQLDGDLRRLLVDLAAAGLVTLA